MGGYEVPVRGPESRRLDLEVPERRPQAPRTAPVRRRVRPALQGPKERRANDDCSVQLAAQVEAIGVEEEGPTVLMREAAAHVPCGQVGSSVLCTIVKNLAF